MMTIIIDTWNRPCAVEIISCVREKFSRSASSLGAEFSFSCGGNPSSVQVVLCACSFCEALQLAIKRTHCGP
jgi:hypothetical protein